MFGGFGITELIVILVIVALLFGTKKLRNLGEDLGASVKGFKRGMNEKDADDADQKAHQEKNSETDTTHQKDSKDKS